MPDFNPTNPEQLGEFLQREFCEATKVRDVGPPVAVFAVSWKALSASERACWTDTARALIQRFDGAEAAFLGSLNEHTA